MRFSRSNNSPAVQTKTSGENPLGSSLPPVAMRVSHQVTLGDNTILMLFVLLASMTGIAIIMHVATRIGLSNETVRLVMLTIPVCIIGFAGIKYSTTRLAQFTNVEGAARAGESGMAMGAELAGLIGVIGFATLFLRSNHEAFATIAGMATGLIFLGLGIVGGLANSQRPLAIGAVNILAQTELINKRGSRLIIALYGLVGVLTATLLAAIALGMLSTLFELTFASENLLVIMLMIVMAMVIAGGQRSLTVANMFFYCLAVGFIAIPAIWLSIRIAGNPFAPLSFGTSALEPMMQLNQQLQSENAPSDNLFGNFSNFVGLTNYLLLTVMVATGISCLPFLHRRVHCNNAIAGKVKTVGIGMACLFALMALIPAIIAFTQFEVYRGVVGLSAQQLTQSAPWLFNWAAKADGSHIQICSQIPVSVQAISDACGSLQYQILPTDLKYTAWMALLGSGAISGMPPVLANMIAIAVLAIGFAIFGASLSGAANSLIGNVIFSSSADKRVTKNPNVASVGQMKRLFLTRLAMLVCAAGAYYLASYATKFDAVQLLYWTLAIASGTLFFALIAAIWWPQIEPYGVLAAQICGLAIVCYFGFQSWKADILHSGFISDETSIQPAAIATGLALIGSAATGLAVHLLIKQIRPYRQNKQITESE